MLLLLLFRDLCISGTPRHEKWLLYVHSCSFHLGKFAAMMINLPELYTVDSAALHR